MVLEIGNCLAINAYYLFMTPDFIIYFYLAVERLVSNVFSPNLEAKYFITLANRWQNIIMFCFWLISSNGNGYLVNTGYQMYIRIFRIGNMRTWTWRCPMNLHYWQYNRYPYKDTVIQWMLIWEYPVDLYYIFKYIKKGM